MGQKYNYGVGGEALGIFQAKSRDLFQKLSATQQFGGIFIWISKIFGKQVCSGQKNLLNVRWKNPPIRVRIESIYEINFRQAINIFVELFVKKLQKFPAV